MQFLLQKIFNGQRNETKYSLCEPGGDLIENGLVVKDIEQTLSHEFCCYGYKNMTAELKDWIGLLIIKKFTG